MSTLAAIRFIGKKGEPIAGLYLYNCVSLTRLIEAVLSVGAGTVPFPIKHWPERIQAREAASALRGVPQERLLFAESIEEYAFFFAAGHHNMVSHYSNHNASLPWRSAADEFFNAIEHHVSVLNINSNYRDNVCFLIDIGYPTAKTLNVAAQPKVMITTGSGRQVFVGDMTHLKNVAFSLVE